MKRKRLLILAHLFLLAISCATVTWLYESWLIDGPHGPYRWVGMDFASYWVGVREMFDRVDPYSPEATLKIQQAIYGGPALGDDPMLFSYPAWLFLVVAPFALLPYKVATIVWVGGLLWATLALLYSIARIAGDGSFVARSLWFLGLVVGSLPFIIISVIKGQPGVLSLIALFASYRLWCQKPLLAGVLLGLALIKPTVTVAPVAIFLLWTLFQRDWRILAGFASNMALLFTSSYLAVGNWIPSYFGMLETKIGTTILWSMDILLAPWNVLYAILFAGTLMLSLYLSHRRKRPYWFAAAVLAGIALTPMRWFYDLFLAILILSDERQFSPLAALLAAMALLSPWTLVVVPAPMRWNVAVVAIPLLWLATLLGFIVSETPRRDGGRLPAISAGD